MKYWFEYQLAGIQIQYSRMCHRIGLWFLWQSWKQCVDRKTFQEEVIDRISGIEPQEAELAEDQSLPVVPEVDLLHDFSPFGWYEQAQQDMIKAGWKKVYTE